MFKRLWNQLKDHIDNPVSIRVNSRNFLVVWAIITLVVVLMLVGNIVLLGTV